MSGGKGVSGMNENDDGDVNEGASGMNENDDENDSAGEGESASGMDENYEDDDDQDIIEGLDWSDQVALEQGTWEYCPEMYTSGTGRTITITDHEPDTPPHTTHSTTLAAPAVFGSTDIRLRTTHPPTTTTCSPVHWVQTLPSHLLPNISDTVTK